MFEANETTAPVLDAPEADTLSFTATDVTQTREVTAVFQRSAPVRTVTRALAQRMALPENVPWALRNDRSEYLDEDKPIGEQLENTGESVCVVPRTHLGAHRVAR